MFRNFKKTRLALALSAAVVGSVASTSTQAVQLAKDGLGDAAIFQYYTAQANWQTFFRIINTDQDSAVAVKVRFREAANSREVLDFIVFLSPGDVWTSWTDNNVGGRGPGLLTNDTSCLHPLPDANAQNEGFQTINGDLKGANFQSRAFTDNTNQMYADGNTNIAARLGEGHMEVIGISEWDLNGTNSSERDMIGAIMHGADGYPGNCQLASTLFATSNTSADEVESQLAFNAYLVNVGSGQGAGYDPAVLANFSQRSLDLEANSTDQQPDMDSADPISSVLPENDFTNTNQSRFGFGGGRVTPVVNTYWRNFATGAAYHQDRADGTAPVGPVLSYSMDLDNDGSALPGTIITIDLDQDGVIDGNETFPETAVPASAANQLAGQPISNIAPLAPGFTFKIDNSGQPGIWTAVTLAAGPRGPAAPREKWSGVLGRQDVRGGVDAVSSLFMRDTVKNEWAASNNPGAVVSDYFTQWVLSFPTKHYYVDLATDTNLADDVSPTLVDPNILINDAISPFTWEFDDAFTNKAAGTSCEPYVMDVYNREERFVQFASPAPFAPDALCFETNVVNFNQRYANEGLDSNFAVTVNQLNLPTDADGTLSERGWANMTFTGTPATTIGLTGIDLGTGVTFPPTNPTGDERVFFGLPVDGFMLSIYNTNGTANNHTTINEHKYTRNIEN